jgi:sugar phosphate isomerase/epimerase
MIKSAVTITLVGQLQTGPWIYWHDLEGNISRAAALGFDAIELFTPAADSIPIDQLRDLLAQYNITLAAVGTGAGKVIHGLSLTDPDPSVRNHAVAFIESMMRFGAAFGAPAIIGSIQGSVAPGIERQEVLSWLAVGLTRLNNLAGQLGVKLIYEPLNRYETNLFNTLADGAAFLERHQLGHTRLLADCFHMNIEEDDLAVSISQHIPHIGHVHFADSNRKPVGYGHTYFTPIAEALIKGGYSGYVSAEALPWPDSDQAAAQTIQSFQQYFRQPKL